MPVMAYVLVKTKPGTSHEIVASRRIPGVKMANSVFGRYDAVIVLVASDIDELSKRVYEIIEKHPFVEKTETLICLPYPEEEKPKPPKEQELITSFHCPSCHALNEVGAIICTFCGYRFK